MLEAADPRGARVELAGLALRELDKVAHRFHRQPGRDREHARAAAEQRDRLERLHDVLRHADQRDRHGQRGRDEKQRVAVRGRLRRRIDADEAASAAAVVHHHALPEPLAELGGDRPADDVVAAAWRERDDQLYGFDRVRLRLRQPHE